MIAIPYTLNFQLRSKISEGLNLATPLKTMVTEYFETYSQLPATNAAIHVPSEITFGGKWTESVVMSDVPSRGTIVITFDNTKLPELGGNNTLLLVPSEVSGHLTWRCGSGTLDQRLRPRNCRDS